MLLWISSLYLNIAEVNNWMSYIRICLENNTFCTCFWGSELNGIFHLYTHLEIVSGSFVRSLALSYFFLATEKREVSSANNLILDFNPSGKSLIYIKKKNVPKWILEELRQVQVASLNNDHLEQLFEIYRSNNA